MEQSNVKSKKEGIFKDATTEARGQFSQFGSEKENCFLNFLNN